MVGGRVIDHVEVHARAEGRSLHLFERDFLYCPRKRPII
jgi:hypothetical protein